MVSDRSVPKYHSPFRCTGIFVNAEGPTHIHNVTFKDFEASDADDVTEFCGIRFKDKFDFGMGASSSVKGNFHFTLGRCGI